MAAQAQFLHRKKEARRTVKSVAVGERDRGEIQLGGGIGVFFRDRCALEKTESGTSVEFNEFQS